MSKIERGYKIIRSLDRSSYTHFVLSRVIYTKNRWTKPRKGCGPLAVFRTRSDAEHFVGDAPQFQIVPCEFVRTRRRSLWRPMSAFDRSGRSAWWRKTHTVTGVANPVWKRTTFPTGTILAEKVKTLA